MTKQRLISDARRRARALSMETGRPYQMLLDDVAQLAGRASWRIFVEDPAPIPEPVIATVQVAEAVEGSRSSNRRRRLACVGGAIALAALPVAAAAALWKDVDDTSKALVTREIENREAPHPVTREVFGIDGRPTYVVRTGESARDLTVPIIDWRGRMGMRDRAISAVRTLFDPTESYVSNDIAMKDFERALGQHLVARMRITIDCRRGTMRLRDMQVADDYVAAPVLSAVPQGWGAARPRMMVKADVDTLCSDLMLQQSAGLLRAIARSKMP